VEQWYALVYHILSCVSVAMNESIQLLTRPNQRNTICSANLEQKEGNLILLVDGNHWIWRSYFAGRNLASHEMATGALHIGLYMLSAFPSMFTPQRVVFLWDGRHPWKKKKFKEYKATRLQDEELRSQVYTQMAIFQKILRCCGIAQIQEDGYEADDLAGLMVGSNHNTEIILVTGDKDWYQLLSKNVKILKGWSGDRTGLEWVTRKTVRLKYGVKTKDWARYQALTGDAGDNIPRVRRGMRVKKILAAINDGENLCLDVTESDRYFRNLEMTTIKKDGPKLKLDVTKQTDAGFAEFETILKQFELFQVLTKRTRIWSLGKWK